MTKDKGSISTIVRELKKLGISDASHRRLLITEELKGKVEGILNNNPHLQEKLAHAMGIGNTITKNLHEVMEKDFHEPEDLIQELVEFFNLQSKTELIVFNISKTSLKLHSSGGKCERVPTIDSPLLGLDSTDHINEKILIDSPSEESVLSINNNGGAICFNINIAEERQLILSFGNKSTHANEIFKIKKLFKTTGLLNRIREKLKHIQTEYTDHLTGLYNKRYIQNAEENNTAYSVIFLDLDKFKEYNDSKGHSAGDILLKETAEIFQTAIRHNDKACRSGGDEFLIFIDDCNTDIEIQKILERIKEKMHDFNIHKEEQAILNGHSYLPLSVTSGYALFKSRGTLRDTISRADSHMLERKEEEGSHGRRYRLLRKIGALSTKEQLEMIQNLISMNPELAQSI